MQLGDTICAISTGAAPGARAMLRVSGPAVGDVLRGLAPGWRPGGGTRGVRLAIGAAGLPGLALLRLGTRSYTGEDLLEVQFPGGPALRRRILDSVLGLRDGSGDPLVRVALPGEFSARAYLNGRLTAEQAEGVGALISSRSSAEFEAAAALISGQTGARYGALSESVAQCLALVEAGIDFADEEGVTAISAERLAMQLGEAIDEIDALLGPGSPREARSELPRIVLVGAPNAGKSTLFNALLRRERAVVSERAGSTRDALAEVMELDPDPLWSGPGPKAGVVLVDLAGLDEPGAALSSASAGAAQRQAAAEVDACDGAIVCDPEGVFAHASRVPAGRSVLRVRTKADLRPGLAGGDLAVCALDGWNLSALRRAIADACSSRESLASAGSVLLPRHRRALQVAREAIRRAMAAGAGGESEPPEPPEPPEAPEPLEPLGRPRSTPAPDRDSGIVRPELAAHWLRLALDSLGEIAGRISPDDVIGRIFATFCIGK